MPTSALPKGSILIAPHQFPDLTREQELAARFGLDLVVARDQDHFASSIAGANVVMVTPYAQVGRAEIDSMKHCRGIVRYGIGYDNIDVASAVEAGVPVSVVPDASVEEVASHAFALGLSLIRRIPAGQAAISAGKWAGAVPADLPVLSEVRVGVIGMGRIGRYVAHWWDAVGAKVSAHDPVARFNDVRQASLDELIAWSDVLSLHIPLTPETRHLISSETIAQMPRGSVIVNVSRGGLIDEQALARALHEGHIAGAGIDVFETEPLPRDHPLRTAPNTILTPHAAWKSRSSLSALQAGAVERAEVFLEGKQPRDLVTG